MRTDTVARGEPLPWSRAWERAAFGAGGFYSDLSDPGPGAHFRTSVHVGAVFHRALAALLVEVDERLGAPGRLDLVDVGSGGGELLAGMLVALPDQVSARVAALAIDVRVRPGQLEPGVRWVQGRAPQSIPGEVRGLLLAHEWLDDVPLDIVTVDPHGGVRLVLVDGDGTESLGPLLSDGAGWAELGLDAVAAQRWIARWWPLVEVGDRAEIGLPRDLSWAAGVRRLTAGTALAIDYGHTADARPGRGSLTSYRSGRAVTPVPDGGANLTAHVALDSVAAAVDASVATQRDSLLALGLTPGLPDARLASTDPVAYAAALAEASDVSELLDPVGLGGFGWVRVDVG